MGEYDSILTSRTMRGLKEAGIQQPPPDIQNGLAQLELIRRQQEAQQQQGDSWLTMLMKLLMGR